MCGSMADIQCLTAEIRRGNKKRRKKKPQDEKIYVHILLCRAATKKIELSGYATWFTAWGAIRIAHYDVIDDVISRKL